jgi:hypothetical protein
MKPEPPTQLVEPTSTPLQYCVCTPAHGLPPTLVKNELTYVCSVRLEKSFPSCPPS